MLRAPLKKHIVNPHQRTEVYTNKSTSITPTNQPVTVVLLVVLRNNRALVRSVGRTARCPGAMTRRSARTLRSDVLSTGYPRASATLAPAEPERQQSPSRRASAEIFALSGCARISARGEAARSLERPARVFTCAQSPRSPTHQLRARPLASSALAHAPVSAPEQ
jgi:hypothetical protein